jgi:hypothetical protein
MGRSLGKRSCRGKPNNPSNIDMIIANPPKKPGGQDSQLVAKDLATKVDTAYLIQTSDEPPAFITMKTQGWRTGNRDVLEKLADPVQADSVNPNTYKFRLTIQMETGDDRYAWVNTGMWVGSGCRRGQEGKIIFASS